MLSNFSFTTQQKSPSEAPFTLMAPSTPLRPLSEEQRLAFPCVGGPQGCWNLQLCPKHRDYQHTNRKASTSTSSPSSLRSDSSARTFSTELSSDYVDDLEARTKIKRHVTDPGPCPDSKKLDIPVAAHHRPVSRSRVPHNLVERRYRDNLNNQIDRLRLMLPSLCDLQPSSDLCEDSCSPRMPSKATIIQTATTYIQDIRKERDRLLDTNKALQDQVTDLQKLLRSCGEEPRGMLQYVNAMRMTTASGI